ncbi:MAG: hypothetical protein L3J67_01610 [Hyphomicrobiaceae bacterium]|nr:hypothetical protein [Hyphomicrobiaceae bacterium]
MLKIVGRIGRLFVFFSTIWFIMATPLLADDGFAAGYHEPGPEHSGSDEEEARMWMGKRA